MIIVMIGAWQAVEGLTLPAQVECQPGDRPKSCHGGSLLFGYVFRVTIL